LVRNDAVRRHRSTAVPAVSTTGILPVWVCGIGILPMLHGLEAHATYGQDARATDYATGA